MHPSFYTAACLVLAVVANPVKPGSVDEGGSRSRCGVVAFEGSGKVWMVHSKADGLILPKGGYDSDKDSNMEDCVVREAKEEAGVNVIRSSIVALSVDDGSVHWFKCKVSGHGTRTDASLGGRKPPRALPVADAMTELKKDTKGKKKGMRKALEAATG
ncbi:hypothetical protein CH063_03286 [Colletotrichum higginsianum]|uniref:Nudix domain-containing protein n=1 Tax=Colletotrichum higginsianum (strain IMI 349063) TaxID=759273 RepID=H1VVK2_COLHI|nr:Nudix domain-containing protein [Colletotrichum higginsianum IMI 349063]OBR02092.1 Nudix domain-containing protein [Colletotrichum higginsianum IMI 349063]CCF44262.1 hypothetical protein CH063_03286 [Colletotrichum higginsianum]